MSQLSPNTTYYVKAYATNAGGTAYGDQVTFTTTAITAPVITTTAITSITKTTATSGGNITADNGGSITARGVCWSTSADPTTADSKTTDGTGTGAFTSSITGLTANTTYYVKAYSTNSAGTSYGEKLSFTTSPTIPSLTTTEITSISYTSGTSGGTITSNGGASVTARGVCWSTSENPTTSDSKTDDGSGTGIFTSSITGLTDGTTYYVRAYATNSIGTEYGNQLSFTTIEIMPPSLTTAEVTSIMQITAVSGGDVIAENGAPVTVRGVCWSTSENPTVSNILTEDGSGTGTFTSSIAGLTAGITYYLRAYATNSAGSGYGNQVSFTTYPDEVSDIDMNVYNVIMVGSKLWMKENLQTTKYQNGDLIGTTTPLTSDVSGETEPKYQWPAGGDETNVATYGRLYTWYAATDARNVCPAGWRVPTDEEWHTLILSQDANAQLIEWESNTAGDKLKESGTSHWLTPNTGATNESNFTALPAGFQDVGTFGTLGYQGTWWTSTYYGVSGGNSAYYRSVEYGSASVHRNSDNKANGYSIRCVND